MDPASPANGVHFDYLVPNQRYTVQYLTYLLQVRSSGSSVDGDEVVASGVDDGESEGVASEFGGNLKRQFSISTSL